MISGRVIVRLFMLGPMEIQGTLVYDDFTSSM